MPHAVGGSGYYYDKDRKRMSARKKVRERERERDDKENCSPGLGRHCPIQFAVVAMRFCRVDISFHLVIARITEFP